MEDDPRQFENIVVNENDIHKIVLSYLTHNCFKDTLESFVSCTGMKQPFDHLEDMEKRKGFRLLLAAHDFCDMNFLLHMESREGIYHFSLGGNASKAIELTEELAPGLLEENKDLHFDLLSLHFRGTSVCWKTDEALGFTQSMFTPFGMDQRYVQRIEDFMSLLAYDEPEKSPMFHLVGAERRQQVADSLNRAILAHAKLPGYCAMEVLIQQMTAVRQCLSQEHGKDGHKPFCLKNFLKS